MLREAPAEANANLGHPDQARVLQLQPDAMAQAALQELQTGFAGERAL
jgi:hypothetical protein